MGKTAKLFWSGRSQAVRLPNPFEGIDNRADLRVGRSVVRCPGDHVRGILVLERQRVGHRGHLMGIPSEDLHSLAQLSRRVQRPLMCRCRWGGRGGHSPPPAPAGDPRSVAPKGRLALIRQTNSVPRRSEPWAVKISIPVH